MTQKKQTADAFLPASEVAAYTIVVRRPAAVLPSQAQAFAGSVVGGEGLREAFAFSGGVGFVFEMPLAKGYAVEACARLGGGGKGAWRLLREGEDYEMVWEDKQDGRAQVTLTLLHANAPQSFLRLSPKN